MSEQIAFVFPGQGSQAVGMGADVFSASPAAHAVFDLADAAVGFPLAQLCFSGPEAALRETINTQPALVATSLALLAALQEAAGTPFTSGGDPALSAPLRPAYVAGHSVGEYAALAASGALGISETLRLVRERGRLMHQEGQACDSGMAAVLGLDAQALQAVCAEATERTRDDLRAAGQLGADAHPGAGVVVLANDNAPGQIVISGARRALDLAMELARERGAKRVVPLAVSGAFHSPVMAPAALGLAKAVDAAPIQNAAVPLVANMTAEPLVMAGDLRSELAHQIEAPVLWTRSIEYLVSQGVTTFVEIGVGQVLAGLIKRIAKGTTTLAVGSAADVAPIAAQLRERLGGPA
ncbi:MAG: Malonyl CoA-acyl carrier protein transacylase [Ktedonobacterales bacterium]|jgi:[acyl-carrier-protein] S-malonyltransferase|nr:MAG: Malonyl CoA-acyl carrier protein transacylase [Ktedonobacterales bacterium]